MSHDPLEPFGPVYPLPVVHYSLEFADAVRVYCQSLRPQAIAVELPGSLKEVVEQGVKRLPEISIVLYQNKSGQTVYLPIEPADPLAEAIRSGLEAGIPVHFIDPDVDEYPSYQDSVPDTYAAYRLGVGA